METLSYLASASVTEDKWGMVQRDLAGLLATLLGLEGALARSRGSARGQEQDLLIRQELRMAIKAGLYRWPIDQLLDTRFD